MRCASQSASVGQSCSAPGSRGEVLLFSSLPCNCFQIRPKSKAHDNRYNIFRCRNRQASMHFYESQRTMREVLTDIRVKHTTCGTSRQFENMSPHAPRLRHACATLALRLRHACARLAPGLRLGSADLCGALSFQTLFLGTIGARIRQCPLLACLGGAPLLAHVGSCGRKSGSMALVKNPGRMLCAS